MVIAAEYPLLNIFWTMLVVFMWILWFGILFRVVADIFRRRDVSGGKKVAWLIFCCFFPFVGVFSYLIVNGDAMAQRDLEREAGAVRGIGTGTSAVAEIDRAKALLDSGAIDQAEFTALKVRVLA